MLDKLQQLQSMAEKSKEKLEEISVVGEAGGNLVVIEMNGNRKITKLSINAGLDMIETEDLEDLLSVALNRALEAVNEINEREMAESAKNIIPGL